MFITQILVTILLTFVKQTVKSSPRMQILLRNASFVNDPTLCNVSATISNAKINLSVIMFHSFESMYVDMHLDVKMLNKPSNKYERFFDKSVNLCDAMINPLLEPMITMIFNKVKDDKRNNIFTKCPVSAVS